MSATKNHSQHEAEKLQSDGQETSIARFLALAQEQADVFWVLTAKGQKQEVCSNWQTFTGQNERVSLGRGWMDVLHPADRLQVEQALIQTVVSGQARGVQCHIRRYDQTYRLMHLRIIPVRIADGTIHEVILCGTDITRQSLSKRMSDTQVQLAIESSGVGIWDWDLVTQELSWTDQSKALFGLKAEETMDYERFMTILHPEDREPMEQMAAEIMSGNTESQQERQAEYRVIWPDGSLHWLAMRARVIYSARGKPLHMVGANIDITDLKRTQMALRESEEQLRTFIDSNIIGITISDIDGSIYEANDAFLALVGYTREELINEQMQWTALTPPEFQVLDLQSIGEMMARGNYRPYEKEYVAKDGKHVPVLIGGAIFHGALRHDTAWQKAGSTQLIISFILDLSARKEVDQQKDLFMGMAGHELKTPLAALKGTLQLLQRRMKRTLANTKHIPPEWDTFTQDLAKNLENSIRLADTQARLINELLDVSRITTDRFKVSLQHCDLLSIVRSAVGDLQMIEPGRSLLLTLPENTNAPVMADPTRIGEVVTNYLTNALRYSPVDQPVHIDLDFQADKVRVCVRDHGPGLSLEARQKIWQRFQQIKEVSTQSEAGGKGLGLGLYICKTVIKQHHGEVGVDSTPGKGCTFWFTLPLAK